MHVLSIVATVVSLAGCASQPARCDARRHAEAGRAVAVSVEVDGRPSPLYAAPDGSGRRYFEARRDEAYVLRVRNKTGGRVAVRVRVDGLNVISGEQEDAHERGRMYVLAPHGDVDIRGWRTSLAEVRAFTFVEEKRSYAVRSGQANARLGWIEVDVFRERPRPRPDEVTQVKPSRDEAAAEAPAARAQGNAESGGHDRDGTQSAPGAYPGTGWGRATRDPAQLVSFEAEPQPFERITLRYEYAAGLRALGIPVGPRYADRLHERDSGTGGPFARPPRLQ